MERKFLEELGLQKEIIEKVMAENGRDIEAQKSVVTTKDSELAAANSTIKELREAVKRFDGKDPDKLQADLAALQKQYDADIAKGRLDAALNLALATGKAKNIKAVRALLNLDGVKLDGDKLTGLDDQLKSLRESDAYLFDQPQKTDSEKADLPPKISSAATHGTGTGVPGSDTLLGALQQHYNTK